MHVKYIRAKFTSEDCANILSDDDDGAEKDDLRAENE